MTIRRFAVATLIAALTLTGCSSGNQEAPSAGGRRGGRHHQRHQPAGPAKLQQGGNLRLALTEFPVELQLAAHRRQRGRAGAMLRATMPRAFRVGTGRLDDGQHRLLHQRRTHRHQPASRHLHHQSQSGLERRHPHHVGRHRRPDPRHQRQGQGLRHRQPQRQRPGRLRDPRRRRSPGGHDVRQALFGVAGHVRRQHHAAAQEHDREPRGVQQGTTQRPRPLRRTVHRVGAGPDRATHHVDPQPEVVGYAAAAGQHHLPGAGRRRPHPGTAEQHPRRHRGGLARRA